MTRARHRELTGTALLVSVSLLLAAPLLGQQASAGRVRLAALQRFHAWVGRWTGSGWSLDRTGQRTDFTLVETVTPKAGGTVLLAEGHGHAKGDSAFTTHDGAVFLYYDEHSAQYRWNGHELRSGSVDAEVTPVDGGFAWSIPAGASGATVRFTILVDERRWHEVGEASADGAAWEKFMEIDLERVR